MRPTCAGILSVALLVSMASCGVDRPSGTSAAASPTTKPSDATVAGPTVVSTTHAPLAEPGREMTVLQTWKRGRGARNSKFLPVIDADGEYVQVVVQAVKNLRIPRETSHLRDLHRPAVRQQIPRAPGWEKRQLIGMDLGPRFIVWTETPSTDLASDPWRLYVFDRKQGTTRELAHAVRQADGRYPRIPTESIPRLGPYGRVFLNSVGRTPQDKIEPVIMSYSLRGDPDPQRIATAPTLAIAGNTLGYASSKNGWLTFNSIRLRRGRPPTAPHLLYRIRSNKCRGVDIAGSGPWLALNADCGHHNRVHVWGPDHYVLIGNDLGYMELSSDLLTVAETAWNGGYHTYALDLSNGRVNRLGGASKGLGATTVGGRYVVWGQARRNAPPNQLHYYLSRLEPADPAA